MKTLDILGEDNVRRISKEHNLSEDEIQLIRKILEGWDEILSIKNLKERLGRKMEITINLMEDLDPVRMQDVNIALLEMTLLFTRLSQERN